MQEEMPTTGGQMLDDDAGARGGRQPRGEKAPRKVPAEKDGPRQTRQESRMSQS
jgi:hypothetical protein